MNLTMTLDWLAAVKGQTSGGWNWAVSKTIDKLKCGHVMKVSGRIACYLEEKPVSLHDS
jgi:hypothetical protein